MSYHKLQRVRTVRGHDLGPDGACSGSGGGTPPQHPKIQRAHPNSSRFGLQTSNDTPLVDEAGLVAGLWKGGVPKAGGLVPKAGPATHYLMAEGRIAATMDDGAE